MIMKEITDGLKNLLLDNHYNPVTIQFYEREWKKIQSFLLTEYGDEGFDMERGLTYLEKQYGFQTVSPVTLAVYVTVIFLPALALSSLIRSDKLIAKLLPVTSKSPAFATGPVAPTISTLASLFGPVRY